MTSVALSPEKSGFGPLLFAGNVEEGVKNAAQLGFSTVELSLRDSDSLDREKIAHLSKENNLKVSTIAFGNLATLCRLPRRPEGFQDSSQ